MLGLKDMAAIVAEHGEALDVALSPIKLTDEFTIADGRPALMGVVNLSPDSWYRESVCLFVDAAVQRGRVLSELGASVVDIGAESTRSPAARSLLTHVPCRHYRFPVQEMSKVYSQARI